MKKRIIVIGLGNPGEEYVFTRHNAGFMFADILAGKFKKSRRCPLLYAGSGKITVVKPLTYMNNSGSAVKCIMSSMDVTTQDILVVCDDFNLSLGKLRLRPGGTAGGHNGLKSIIDTIGTNAFPRLRIGIGGEDKPDKTRYVLQRFKKNELKQIEDSLVRAKELFSRYLDCGIEKTMNEFN
ncbi:MAG: aminoacyl-tRNA hydrolase [Elusimicrobia bacterium]|nr:aminoacyl-tRNA hydrolase [Elusimicrobiota bacterium]